MAVSSAADLNEGGVWTEIHDRLAAEDAARMERLNASIERSTLPHVRRWKEGWAAARTARKIGTVPRSLLPNACEELPPRRSIQLPLFAMISAAK